MRFIVLRHQEEEGLGTIGDWLKQHGHAFFYVNLFAAQRPPANALMAYDALVSMGGSDVGERRFAPDADFSRAHR